MCDVLGRLHRVDWRSLGLDGLASSAAGGDGGVGAGGATPAGRAYATRQVRRWKKQYLASCAAVREAPLENMMLLAAYLERHAPKEDSRSGADATTTSCIIHGDFRMDNMIYKDGTDEVAAVLDFLVAGVCGSSLGWRLGR